MTFYHLNVFFHLLASVYWLGGMFFFAAVGAPVLRTLPDARERSALFRDLGRRFRSTAWIAILVLLGTGIGNLHFRGLLRWEIWSASGFWITAYGQLLAAKLALVAGMISVQLVHDFWLGPKASAVAPHTPQGFRFRKAAAWLGRGNALLGLVLLYVAVRLVRG